MTGQELQELRNEMGWTQYFLADVLGIPRSSIAHWEQERAPVPVNVAEGMRKAAVKVGQARSALVRAMTQ
jgi:transcriptional regulator with XRE-family HTH domain